MNEPKEQPEVKNTAGPAGSAEDLSRVFDAHTHLFSPAVIENVLKRKDLVKVLHLDAARARGRIGKDVLKREAAAAGVQCCLLLPTAPADRVCAVNDSYYFAANDEKGLVAAGTLHPAFHGIEEELLRLGERGVRAIKLSSFSQGFDPCSEEALGMFEKIRANNLAGSTPFIVIMDTFYDAGIYFDVSPDYVTTPKKLRKLAEKFPEIDFVGAHMGGLAAPSWQIREYLGSLPNLYLDTSNAAHVLPREEFLRLLDLHGPDHIIFGTDWPWFGQLEEVRLIRDLLHEAGCSPQEETRVFGANIRQLLG